MLWSDLHCQLSTCDQSQDRCWQQVWTGADTSLSRYFSKENSGREQSCAAAGTLNTCDCWHCVRSAPSLWNTTQPNSSIWAYRSAGFLIRVWPELLTCRETCGFLERSSSRRWRSISSLEREISSSYSAMVLPNTPKISSAASVSRWLMSSRSISILDILTAVWEENRRTSLTGASCSVVYQLHFRVSAYAHAQWGFRW